MELSNKKNNAVYAIFLIITVFLFFIFITSRSWYGKDAASYSEDYNTVRSIGGYYIKISNAIYLTDAHQLLFTYSVKEISSGSSQGDEPEVQSVWLDSAQNELSFSVGRESISKSVLCENADDSFKRVIIKVVFHEPDRIIEDQYDEFGDIIPGSVEKGEEDIERITIDKRDILFMTSAQVATMTTTRAVLTQSSDESHGAVLTTSNIITTPNTTTGADSDASETSKKTTTTSKTEEATTTTKSISTQAESQVQQSNTQTRTSTTTRNTTTSQTTRASSATTTTKNQSVRVTGIKLNTGFEANNVVLTVNKSAVVYAVISPSNADNKSVTWSSNRPDIASVDSNGKITGQSAGKAIITATTADGALTASCMVTVSE